MIYINFIIIIFFFTLGKTLKNNDKLQESTLNKMNNLIIYVLLPGIILNSIDQLPSISGNLVLIAVNSVWVVTMAIIGIILCFLMKTNQKLSGTLTISFCTLEGGSIGLAMMLMLFNTKYLPEFFLLDVTNAVMLFSFAYLISHLYGKNGSFDFKLITSFLSGPIMLSLVAGIILSLMDIRFPPIISDFLNAMGYLILPIIMITLGAHFKFNAHHLIPASIYSIVKIGCGVILGAILIKIFAITNIGQKISIMIISSLPPSYLVTVFAKEKNLDTDSLSSILPVSTIISIGLILISYDLFNNSSSYFK